MKRTFQHKSYTAEINNNLYEIYDFDSGDNSDDVLLG
jgi:hypothetical protein